MINFLCLKFIKKHYIKLYLLFINLAAALRAAFEARRLPLMLVRGGPRCGEDPTFGQW